MTSSKVDPETSRKLVSLLPHRYPFLLVDRIVEYEPGKRIVGLKGITQNEHFFIGHFPGFPILPGVIIMEAMAQTGGILAIDKSGEDIKKVLPVFTRIEKARFRRPVFPGDQLFLDVEVMRLRHPVWWFSGKGYVDGQVVAEGHLQATMSNLGALNF